MFYSYCCALKVDCSILYLKFDSIDILGLVYCLLRMRMLEVKTIRAELLA